MAKRIEVTFCDSTKIDCQFSGNIYEVVYLYLLSEGGQVKKIYNYNIYDDGEEESVFELNGDMANEFNDSQNPMNDHPDDFIDF